MMRSLAVLCLLVFFTLNAFAAEVTKVKGKNVLIDLKGTSAVSGDTFYAIKSNGKRSAIIKISKVKGEKAIGKIIKGKAEAGMSMELKPASIAGSGGSSKKSSGDGAKPTGGSYWGVIAGYAQDSMSVNVNSSTVAGQSLGQANLSGSGFSFKGLFDYELFPQIWFRGTTGLEMFNVSGDAKCGPLNRDACDAKINYLTFDFMARYVFTTDSFRPWAGFGIGLLFPMSKEATALQSNSISTTNVMVPALGFDWFISSTSYIPVSVEYGMLPKSDEVDAKWIAFRVGYAFPF